jgi:hypothetical protein
VLKYVCVCVTCVYVCVCVCVRQVLKYGFKQHYHVHYDYFDPKVLQKLLVYEALSY